MKPNELEVYMQATEAFAQLSHAKRAKVSCILVRDRNILGVGINGRISGSPDNICEDAQGNTRQDVLHAEVQCLCKLAKSNESAVGATVFCTLSPCVPCSLLLANVKVKEVYYRTAYRDLSGVDWLNSVGIPCKQLIKEN